MTALIGALRVSLSADTAQFQSGMKRAERQAKTSATNINKSLGIVAAGFKGLAAGLSVGLLVRGIKGALDYAGSLGEVSQQLGVTTRDLQVFRYAAGQTGVSQEQLETGLQKLTITLGQMAAGAKAPREALEAVRKGLADQVLQAKDTGDAFRLISDALSQVSDRSQRAAVEVALFGRSGAKLDNLLAGGSKALNELADAADRLGIVLSDEQIQKADETADKLEAVKTMLSAQIAGVVADNADAILGLANALLEVAGASAKALNQFGKLVSFLASNIGILANPTAAIGKMIGGPGSSQTRSLRTVKPGTYYDPTNFTLGDFAKRSGGGIGQFLKSGGGGGSKRSPKAARDTSLRDAFQFEEEQRRAEMDILRAKQDLAHDYVERTALSIQILNLEKEGFEAELQFRVASKEITAAQAEKLRLKNDEVDTLRRQAVLEDEELARQRDYNMLDEKDADLKLDILEKQADLADTWQERRAVELRILDLAYDEERRRLERIVQESKDWAEIEAARRDLLALSQKQALDREGVRQRTRGPMEQASADFSDLTDEMENLRVNGIMAAGDALATLATEGFGSFKQQAISAIKAVIAEFIRLQTIKAIFSAIGAATGAPTGGIPMFSPSNPGVGFASGGFTGNIGRNRVAGFVHGQEGVLNTRGLSTLGVPNLNALNRGAPLAAVSNDNGGMGGDMNVNVNLPRGMSPREGRATGLAIGRGVRERMAYTARGRSSR